MGMFVYSVYDLSVRILPNVIAVLLGVIVGVAVYFLGIVLTKGISLEVIESLPFSGKIEAVYNRLENFFNHG